MNDRFVAFLRIARWASAVVALMYHVRFLLFVDYGAVQEAGASTAFFYFITGLGQEAFAVFFVLDGMLAGRGLLQRRQVPHAAALYRLLLPGLALGAACDLAGLRFANGSGLYTAYPELSTMTLSLSALLGNLLMLQPFIVPDFGSNSMLYLLSYLFWCGILLTVVMRSGEAGRPGTVLLRALLAAAIVWLLPGEFLLWAAVWLCGVAVVLLADAGWLRPPVWLAGAAFGVVLALSRLLGSGVDLLPQPLGHWLMETRVWFVGAAFAALARALHPHGRTVPPAPALPDGLAAQAASFTFFFHFPVMMLLTGLAADLLGLPLVQQPAAPSLARFACIGAAAVALCVMAARAAGAVATGRTVRA